MEAPWRPVHGPCDSGLDQRAHGGMSAEGDVQGPTGR